MDKRLLIANGIGLLLIAGLLSYFIYSKEHLAVPSSEVEETATDAMQFELSDSTKQQIKELEDQGLSVNLSVPGQYETQVLLSQKFKKRPDEIKIAVSHIDSQHLRGTTSIGSGGVGNTGIVFASNIHGDWELVWDGNGVIPCKPLVEYNFPEEMRQDCIEE